MEVLTCPAHLSMAQVGPRPAVSTSPETGVEALARCPGQVGTLLFTHPQELTLKVSALHHLGWTQGPA
jgi:hypothetical protein